MLLLWHYEQSITQQTYLSRNEVPVIWLQKLLAYDMAALTKMSITDINSKLIVCLVTNSSWNVGDVGRRKVSVCQILAALFQKHNYDILSTAQFQAVHYWKIVSHFPVVKFHWRSIDHLDDHRRFLAYLFKLEFHLPAASRHDTLSSPCISAHEKVVTRRVARVGSTRRDTHDTCLLRARSNARSISTTTALNR